MRKYIIVADERGYFRLLTSSNGEMYDIVVDKILQDVANHRKEDAKGYWEKSLKIDFAEVIK
jgi:hypothetical protein